MKGVDWRLLLVSFETVILPAVGDETRKSDLRELFQVLSDIQWIAYSKPHVRQNKNVRLRLHVLCFLLSIHMQTLYKEVQGSGMSYLHTMISHYGPFYESCDFLSASTEPGEALFAVLKRILLRTTNRQEKNSLSEVFVRLHFEEQLTKKRTPTANKKVRTASSFTQIRLTRSTRRFQSASLGFLLK